MRDEMRKGDGVLFYHSNATPSGIAGIAEVVREAYPDDTAFDPKDPHYDPKSDPKNPTWYMVDVRYVRSCRTLIPLERLRKIAGLGRMLLFHNSRLSVQPVTPGEWKIITGLADCRQGFSPDSRPR